MRPSCLDCARKHLAQAAVLMAEAAMGYPEHRWLAIGHMAEAAEELVENNHDLANRIRADRKRYERGASVDIMDLINAVSLIEADQPKDPRFDSSGLYVPRAPVEDHVDTPTVRYSGQYPDDAESAPKEPEHVDTAPTVPIPSTPPAQRDLNAERELAGFQETAQRAAVALDRDEPFPPPTFRALVATPPAPRTPAAPSCAEKAALQILRDRLTHLYGRASPGSLPTPVCTTVLLTTLGDFRPSYSLSSVIVEQAHALALVQHAVVIVVHEGADLSALPPLPEQILVLPILPRVPLADDVIDEKGVDRTYDTLWHLFRCLASDRRARIISHDLCFQAAFVTVAKAIHQLAATPTGDIPWYHLAHSSVGERSGSTVTSSGIDASGARLPTTVRPIWYRQNLPPGHHLIVLNQSDVRHFGAYYHTGRPHEGLDTTPISYSHIHVALNPRDIRPHLRMTPLASQITTQYQLHLVDVCVLFPASWTRLREKGLDQALAVIGALKRMGLTVRMVIPVAHANGDRTGTMSWIRSICDREALILAPEVGPGGGGVPVPPPTGNVAIDAVQAATIRQATSRSAVGAFIGAGDGLGLGPVVDVSPSLVPDVILTASVLPATRAYGLDADTLRGLWGVSNLFLMPSISEAGPLVLLEAALSGCVLCLNASLPALHDYIPLDKAAWVPWGSNKGPGAPMDRSAYDRLAERLWGVLQGPTGGSLRRYAMRQHSLEVYGMYLHQTLGFAVAGVDDGRGSEEGDRLEQVSMDRSGQ